MRVRVEEVWRKGCRWREPGMEEVREKVSEEGRLKGNE